jgi:hypothetical protein
METTTMIASSSGLKCQQREMRLFGRPPKQITLAEPADVERMQRGTEELQYGKNNIQIKYAEL